MPYLQGKYIFGDLNTGKIYFADVNDLALGAQATIQQLILYSGGLQKTLLQILGGSATRTDLRFGLDADGEIYLTTKFDGKVRRLVSRTQDPTWTPPAALPDVSGVTNLPDATASYRVSNLSNASLFTVQPGVAANGTLTFTPAAMAFGTATFTLTAEDAGGTAFGRVNVSTPQTITITIAPANHPPTAIALSATSISENAAVGTSVGTFSTADVDPLDTFTYALVSGTGDADNASFTIVGNTLKTAVALNYEAKSSYSIRVRSTDSGGLTTETQFTISVLDLPEPVSPPVATVPNIFSVVEDQSTGLIFTGTPFTDADSPLTRVMTVTLKVANGTISALSGDGVAVSGKAIVRTFTGPLSALNAFFRASPACIIYTPLANSTKPVVLTTTISEPSGLRALSSSVTSTIAITAVDDAPIVSAPGSFTVKEDIRGNLAWPARGTPFIDVDSSSLTVTLSVPDGTISATSSAGVIVSGTPTDRIFTGSTAALNDYFRRLGSIGYTSALDSVATQRLTTTVSDGSLSASKVSTIAVVPVNDAPTAAAVAMLAGGRVGIPFEMTYDALRTAANVRDIETANPGILVQAVSSGSLQRWTGIAWVALPATPTASVSQRLITAGQRIRWLPPGGAIGTRAAFTLKAFDGAMMSATTTQVFVSLE